MRSNFTRAFVLAVVTAGGISLGGCATTEEVERAQSTADAANATANQALQTAQSAHAAAASAQQTADAARADHAQLASKVAAGQRD